MSVAPSSETKTTLTPEEESEFTVVNAAAFDLHRKESAARGEITACWLVMSTEVKEQCRKKLYAHLRDERFEFRFRSDKQIHLALNSLSAMLPTVARWREAELGMKRVRVDERNPRAFFMG